MRIKTIAMMLACLFFTTVGANAQNWGIGVRVGDLTGLTLKKYNAKTALEFNLGTSNMFYGKGYYGKNFDRWYDNNYKGKYKDFEYLSYHASPRMTFQFHYLFHNKTKSPGFEWYWGIGGQARHQRYYYNYKYKVDGDWVYVTDEAVTDIDLGVDGVFGIEYKFKGAPFSVFADGTVYLELADYFGYVWLQAGGGIRYRF